VKLDERRTELHEMWESVAGGWAEHAAFVDARGAAVTERLLETSAPRHGERLLELACGPGSVGIAAAALVGDAGEVVLSDVAPAMTAIAAARAESLGLENVSARVLDLEQIDEPDESFDVVVCREGLMLVPDPVRAAHELRRVLRPGGRAAVSVWGPRERNPWLGVVFDAVSAELGVPMPPPGVPGPFSLDDAGKLESVLVDAGLADVEITEVPTPYRAGAVEEWWTRTAALAGPLAKRLARLPEPVGDALRARARQAVGEYVTASGLDIPGVSRIGSGMRR
jgi:ubiquinone/menaquinone biosynthesis C-methylase UbiE